MIYGIRGKLHSLEIGRAVIDTTGLMYEVLISFKTHLELKNNLNQDSQLYIYHSITDRSQRLFGFTSEDDRKLFVLLKSLNGIGELTALKILSFYTAEELVRIVASEERDLLEKIPKVKGKTSEKIMFEIRQNLKKFEALLGGQKFQETKILDSAPDLAVLGLIELGYDPKTAAREAARVVKEKGFKDTADIIREVLKGA